ncbi:MAG TPA: sigma factor [Mucilaginibacter sp.]
MSEEDLILALKAHTPAGAEALYDQYAVRLFRVISSRVGDRVEAEQVLLEVFERIWQEIGSYDTVDCRLAVWIMAITRRLSKKK